MPKGLSLSEYLREYHKRRISERLMAGLCTRCSTPPNSAMPGHQCCEECVTRERALKRGNPKFASALKERRDRWRSQGICVTCGNKRSAEGKALCDPCAERQRKYYEKQYAASSEPFKKRGQLYKVRLFEKVVAGYGGKCACPDCPESNVAFLTIDHVNDDGAAHRKIVSSNTIYRQVIKEDFPPRYRLLCFNCNMGRYFRGGGTCPHTLTKIGLEPLQRRAYIKK